MRLVLIVAVLGLFWSRPGAAEELRPQVDDLTDHFIEVVFGVEYANLTTRPDGLAKWQGPVVGINPLARKTPELVALIAKHLKSIAQLTGLGFRSAKPGETLPGIDVVFMKRAEMGNIRGENLDQAVIQSLASDPTMVCYFLNWRSPPEQIVKALVVVNVEFEPVRIDACLLEELTQVMGLPNDVQAYWPSMFNPNDTSTVHSRWDRLYLRMLYDRRLKPGMTPDEVRAVVRPIFAEALSKMP